MPREQILMGVAIVVVCLFGLTKCRWFLEHTNKGKRLVEWFGESRAVYVLRGLYLVGILFGTLLALNVIRPVQW